MEEDHFVNARSTTAVTPSAPTTSPREFVSGASAEPVRSRARAERGTRASAGPSGALRPVLDLERDAEAVAGSASSPSAPPLTPSRAEPHELGVGARRPRDELGPRAHRVRDARSAVESLEPGERVRHPLEREAVGDDAAAVDGRRNGAASTSAAAATSASIACWHGCDAQPVPLGRPPALAAQEQHRRVLPRAVVLDPRRLRPALEVVLGRRPPSRAGFARARADRADGGARRMRSRSPRRRDPVAPGRPAAPGAASRSCGRA